MNETTTAHRSWDRRWASDEGRADWLSPEADVVEWSARARERGCRRALDLGCGVGRHALYLAEAGFETHALDGSETGIEHLLREASGRGLGIDARIGLMTDLPYPDDSFDYVLSFNVIYHGDGTAVRKAISEIARVLRPGGLYQGTMLSKRNALFGVGREIASDTFVVDAPDPDDEDKDHPHFYCDAAGLVGLFGAFEPLSLLDREHGMPGSGHWHWHLVAERRS